MAHLQAQYKDYTESKYHGMNVSLRIMAQQCEPVVTTTVSPTSQQHYKNYKYQSIVVYQHNMAWYEPMVAWTMVSTTLAKAEQPKIIEIPPEFHQYGKVFSDEEAQRLPKHQPWDYKINLIPGMEMKKTTVYHLIPIEKVALK